MAASDNDIHDGLANVAGILERLVDTVNHLQESVQGMQKTLRTRGAKMSPVKAPPSKVPPVKTPPVVPASESSELYTSLDLVIDNVSLHAVPKGSTAVMHLSALVKRAYTDVGERAVFTTFRSYPDASSSVPMWTCQVWIPDYLPEHDIGYSVECTTHSKTTCKELAARHALSCIVNAPTSRLYHRLFAIKNPFPNPESFHPDNPKGIVAVLMNFLRDRVNPRFPEGTFPNGTLPSHGELIRHKSAKVKREFSVEYEFQPLIHDDDMYMCTITYAGIRLGHDRATTRRGAKLTACIDAMYTLYTGWKWYVSSGGPVAEEKQHV